MLTEEFARDNNERGRKGKTHPKESSSFLNFSRSPGPLVDWNGRVNTRKVV